VLFNKRNYQSSGYHLLSDSISQDVRNREKEFYNAATELKLEYSPSTEVEFVS